MIVMTVTIPGLRDLQGRFAKWDSTLARFRRHEAQKSVVKMTATLQQFAPKRTGQFSRSLYGRVLSPTMKTTQVRFYSRDPKARFVIYPTRPHIIRARGRALRFGGMFRKQVSHPGTRGSDFMSQAFRVAGPTFIQAMNRVGVRAVTSLAGRGA